MSNNDFSNGLGYGPGEMGWVIPDTHTEQEMLDAEKRWLEKSIEDYPIAFQARQQKEMLPVIKAKWEKFQLDKGRFPGSVDMTLLDEFVFGKSFVFREQPIGSCVFSNSFRPWVARAIAEIALFGDLEEYTGLQELGPKSIAPFCVSYGLARQRANMKSGDGLYCKPMQDSYLKDGIVLCNTPKVKELMGNAGNDSYPEPRSAGLYRQIGNWAWNEALKPYLTCRVLDAPIPKNMDEFNKNIDDYKPMFQCSMIAVRKVGDHRDGFAIHGIDPTNQWAHNMGLLGRKVSSDGRRFVIVCNTSWNRNPSNPEAYIYNIPEEDFARAWFPKIDVGVIGEIDGIQSLPANL
jgi:hypothetical protein